MGGGLGCSGGTGACWTLHACSLIRLVRGWFFWHAVCGPWCERCLLKPVQGEVQGTCHTWSHNRPRLRGLVLSCPYSFALSYALYSLSPHPATSPTPGHIHASRGASWSTPCMPGSQRQHCWRHGPNPHQSKAAFHQPAMRQSARTNVPPTFQRRRKSLVGRRIPAAWWLKGAGTGTRPGSQASLLPHYSSEAKRTTVSRAPFGHLGRSHLHVRMLGNGQASSVHTHTHALVTGMSQMASRFPPSQTAHYKNA